MTSTALTPPVDGTRATRLRGVVLVAAAGPLAITVLRGILPYSTDDPSLTIVDKIAAAPAAQTAVLWLSYLALLTLPLGVLIVGRAAAAARPVLGRIAATLAWIGFVSLFWIVATDQLALAGAASGIPSGTVAALTDAVNAEPTVSVATLVFVAGHILGTVLLGIALWRVLPRWVAAALIVSQPLHLVFAVVVPNHLLDALAWALTTLGFAWTAAVAGSAR